jgi:hypothetical protein
MGSDALADAVLTTVRDNPEAAAVVMQGVTGDEKASGILGAVRAIASARASVLEPHGWRINVVDFSEDAVPMLAKVDVAHPLRPGERSFNVSRD